MKKIYFICSFLIFLFLISGCGSSGDVLTATPTETISPTFTITSTLTPTLPPTLSPTPTPTLTPTPLGGASGVIVFTRDEIISNNLIVNIFTLNLNTMVETNLTLNNNPNIIFYAPAVSPDGQRVAYSRRTSDEFELFVMDINGENVRKISPTPLYEGNLKVDELLIDWQPAWSPDSKKIAFNSNRHLLSNDYYDYEIYIIDLDTYEVRQLTDENNFSQHPWFSPDGTQLVFMSDREGVWNIYIMNVDGSDVTKITQGQFSNRFPKWSTDGNSIVFHSERDGSLDLFIYNLSDKTTEKVTNDPASNVTASFSPDSNWIVYTSDTTGYNNLFILNLISGEIKQITDNQYDDFYPDWSN